MVSAPYAALDVGSNTIRLLIATLEGGSLVPVRDESEFVRLGLGVDTTGELSGERELAAIGAINRLAAIARDSGATNIAAIATSAVRDARNGRAFLQEVRAATGVDVRIISGDEEAQLTFLGATIGIPLHGGVMVVDLGGGSAEIVAADETGITWARSVPLGSGRLTERFVKHDPPQRGSLERLREHVDSVLADLPSARMQRAILTGGTATQIAVLSGKSMAQASPLHIQPDIIDEVLNLLCRQRADQIVREYGVMPERAAVLPAGVAAISAIIHYYSVAEVIITRQGIREGIIEAVRRGVLGF